MGLEQDQTSESDTIANKLEACDSAAQDPHGADNEQNIFEHTGERERKRRSGTDQKHRSHIQTKGDACIRQEHKGTKLSKCTEWLEALEERQDIILSAPHTGEK